MHSHTAWTDAWNTSHYIHWVEKRQFCLAWKRLCVHFALPNRDAGPVSEEKTYRTPVSPLSSDSSIIKRGWFTTTFHKRLPKPSVGNQYQKSSRFLDSNLSLDKNPKIEIAFWSLFCYLTKLACFFFCLESEGISAVNAIRRINFFERSLALFLNDGQGLDTHHLPTGSFQRQISSVTNPSPTAERVWSFLIHLLLPWAVGTIRRSLVTLHH